MKSCIQKYLLVGSSDINATVGLARTSSDGLFYVLSTYLFVHVIKLQNCRTDLNNFYYLKKLLTPHMICIVGK